MSRISQIVDPLEFSNINNNGSNFVVDWRNAPNMSTAYRDRLQTILLLRIDSRHKKYVYTNDMGEAYSINVDIADLNAPVYLSVCQAGAFNCNFGQDQSVLLADNPADSLPIHISFDPPIRALGTHISAVGPHGASYHGVLAVHLAGSMKWEGALYSEEGTISHVRDSAPYLGVVAADGCSIDEVKFDVTCLNDGAGVKYIQVAINDLHFLP